MSTPIKPPKFHQIVDLPQSLLPTFTNVATFADTHVKKQSVGTQVAKPGKPATGQFIWTDFRTAITTRPGTDIAFDRVQSTTIRAAEDASEPATDLAAKVTGFIAGSFPAVAREELAERVEAAFADPSEDESKGVLTSVRSHDAAKGSDKTGWEYRLICAYPNADLPDHFYALVTTVKYTDEATKKPGRFGMGGSTKHSYSADVVAMQVAVEKGQPATLVYCIILPPPSNPWDPTMNSKLDLTAIEFDPSGDEEDVVLTGFRRNVNLRPQNPAGSATRSVNSIFPLPTPSPFDPPSTEDEAAGTKEETDAGAGKEGGGMASS
uniref:Pst2p n=1 Tax=Ganoderma boninense TaxID=34458 RepID=A0A5K1K7N9_9APHY|nr:Pst2p [Ganoderma boninense]